MRILRHGNVNPIQSCFCPHNTHTNMAFVNEIAPELVATQKPIKYPAYKYRRIPATTGTGDFTIGPATSNRIEFEIPSVVFNPSKSQVRFTIKFPCVNGKYRWIRKDCPAFITQAQLRIINGQALLMDLPHAAPYLHTMLPIGTTLQEGTTRGRVRRQLLNADGFENMTGVAGGMFDSTKTCHCVGPKRTDLAFAVDFDAKTFDVAQSEVRRADGSHYESPFESVQVTRSQLGEANTNADETIRFDISLSDFKKTFLDRDKDTYIGERLLLSLLIGPTEFLTWTGDSLFNPATVPIPNAASLTVSDFYLNLAIEDDPVIAQDVIDTYLAKGGFVFPYPYTVKQARGTTAQNINFSLSRGWGESINCIVHTVSNPMEQKNTALDNSNLNWVGEGKTDLENAVLEFGPKRITRYRTSLNNSPLQNYDLECSKIKADDWNHNHDFVKDKMFAGHDAFRSNWFHMDNFSSSQPGDDDVEHISGKSLLSDPQSWDFWGTMVDPPDNGQYMHITYIVINRVVTTGVGARILT